MAYQFVNEAAASFKVQKVTDGKYLTLKGISSTEQNAQVICNGMASLLAIANLGGVYENASRVVTENVDDDGN